MGNRYCGPPWRMVSCILVIQWCPLRWKVAFGTWHLPVIRLQVHRDFTSGFLIMREKDSNDINNLDAVYVHCGTGLLFFVHDSLYCNNTIYLCQYKYLVTLTTMYTIDGSTTWYWSSLIFIEASIFRTSWHVFAWNSRKNWSFLFAYNNDQEEVCRIFRILYLFILVARTSVNTRPYIFVIAIWKIRKTVL